MSIAKEEAVHSVPETGFTANDIQESLSLSHPNSGSSEGSNRAVNSVDMRKIRRKISNRESARRSQLRKKRHLENLTVELNQLRVENQDLKNQLNFVLDICDHLLRENEQLNTE